MNQETAADIIIDYLNGLCGFDDWWDSVDEITQAGIKEELNSLVNGYMEREKAFNELAKQAQELDMGY